MEKEKLESLLIDYIDGKLNDVDKREVEKMLETDLPTRQMHDELKTVMKALDDQQEFIPGESLRLNFQKMLAQESIHPSQGKQVFFSPAVMRAAAALILVMVGVGIGYWINKNQQQENEMAALRQQMLEMKQMMIAQMNNDQSASQRIIGVSAAYQMENADDEIVKVLVKTMNEDPNSNVRLAALEALSKFTHEQAVRKALVQSLKTQKDPVVQIPLIQLLVKMKEKGVVNELQRIADDVQTIKAVKDEAYSGILKLS